MFTGNVWMVFNEICGETKSHNPNIFQHFIKFGFITGCSSLITYMTVGVSGSAYWQSQDIKPCLLF